MPRKKNITGLFKIVETLPRKRRAGFVWLILGMIVSAVLEAVLLLAVMSGAEFLSEGTVSDGPIAFLFHKEMLDEPGSDGKVVILFLLTTVILTTIARLSLLKGTASLAYSAGRDISMKLLECNLNAQVHYFSSAGSASLIGATNRVQILSHTVFLPILRSIGSVFLAVAIMATVFSADPSTALIAMVVIGGTYGLTTFAIKPRLRRNGLIISGAQEKRIALLRESIGSVREIKLYENHQIFEREFDTQESKFRKAQADNLYLSQAPRYIIEAIGLILLGGLVFASAYNVEFVSTSLPAIGALAIGAQRMLPLVQQVFNGWAQFSGNSSVIHDLSETIEALERYADPERMGPTCSAQDWNHLTLAKVEYRHDNDATPAISSADFRVNKGEKFVVTGKTGSGKSTLIDLIMTFRRPTGGSILLDDSKISDDLAIFWRRQIAFVPQAPFLLDGTIRDNILFGKAPNEEDDLLLQKVLHLTDLEDTVGSLPYGLDTEVGEDGIRLSGGQRQRLAIARALFRKRPVLVLDEATSALDDDTERKILHRLSRERPDLTVIHITHRAHPLERSSKRINVEDGLAQLTEVVQA